MKKSTVILFLLISSYYCSYSQNLTINEIASLRNKSFGSVEEILSNKNWTFLSGSEPNSQKMGNATFAFNKAEFNDNAESFFEFLYDNSENEEICSHKIFLQFFDKAKYISYLNQLKSLGCKLIKSKIEDGNVVKIYQGATTTFKITIIAEKDDFGTTKTSYTLSIIGNVDYFIYYDEDTTLRELLQKQIDSEQN